jgi:thiamine kinase-like enzyme
MIQKEWPDAQVREYVSALPIWKGKPQLEPIVGGLCNSSYKATDGTGSYVARIGFDIPVHGIYQTSVQATAEAGSRLGVTPEVVHIEPALIVARFVSGGTLRPEHIHQPATLAKIVALMKQLHAGSAALNPAAHYFWPFQVARRYCEIGRQKQSRLMPKLAELERIAGVLEREVVPFTPVFTHNDLVPQNFVFDERGEVLLIDWDYGGFGNPNFDLAATMINSDAPEDLDLRIVELYHGQRTKENWRQYRLFKVAVSLREYLWGMVQEVTSELAPELVAASMSTLYSDQKAGYEGYTDMNEARFNLMWDGYRREFGL